MQSTVHVAGGASPGEAKADQYRVRQLELFYSPDGKGVYYFLEGPDEAAVRNHHNENCSDVIRAESLL